MFKPIQERRIEVELSTPDSGIAKSIFRNIVQSIFPEIDYIKFSKGDGSSVLELKAITACNSDVLQKLAEEMSSCDIRNFIVEIISDHNLGSTTLPDNDQTKSDVISSTVPEDSVPNRKTVKNESSLPTDILKAASTAKSLQELATFISDYFSYPEDLIPELEYILDRVLKLVLEGNRVSWDSILDKPVSKLAYKKRFVTPFKKKFGSSIRFPIFLREVISSFTSASKVEQADNQNGEDHVSADVLSFSEAIKTNAFLENPGVLGSKAEEFLNHLKTVYESDWDLRKKVLFLYSYIYLQSTGYDFSAETNNRSVDFITYTISHDLNLENGIEASEFKDFQTDELSGETNEYALMKTFLSTGQVVYKFMQDITGEEVSLKDFLSIIRPVIVSK